MAQRSETDVRGVSLRSAIKFCERLGAFPMDGWTVFRLTGKALEDLANARGTG